MFSYFIRADKWITSFILGASVELYGIHTKDKLICCEGERVAWKIPSLWSQGTIEGGGSLRVTQPGPLLEEKLRESFIKSAYEFSVSGSALLLTQSTSENLIVTRYSLIQDLVLIPST